MDGIYTLKPEIAFIEEGNELFKLYVDAETELSAEEIMAAVPDVTCIGEKKSATYYTDTAEENDEYCYDVSVKWDSDTANPEETLLYLVKQFETIDGVQFAMPESGHIAIYVMSADDYLLYPLEKTTSSETVVLGDVNCDGKVDVTDAVLMGKAASGAVELSTEQRTNADVNRNNEVDSNDTVLMMQFLVHLVDTLG